MPERGAILSRLYSILSFFRGRVGFRADFGRVAVEKCCRRQAGKNANRTARRGATGGDCGEQALAQVCEPIGCKPGIAGGHGGRTARAKVRKTGGRRAGTYRQGFRKTGGRGGNGRGCGQQAARGNGRGRSRCCRTFDESPKRRTLGIPQKKEGRSPLPDFTPYYRFMISTRRALIERASSPESAVSIPMPLTAVMRSGAMPCSTR